MQSMFDERLWLEWLVKVRILILTFLLGIELLINQFTAAPLPVRPFVSAILLWYTLSIFYVLLLSFWREHHVQSVLQVLTDLLLATVLIEVTGGVDSSLNFLYPLIIIVACILLPRVWAILSAALAFLLYGSLLELNYFGLIPSFSSTRPELRTLQAIILINPNNPTGAVYSKKTLEGIVEIARRHNLIIFADEIYDKLIIDDDAKHYSIATMAPDVPCITFNGLSKAYLAPGWRIGWGIATGPAEILAPYLEGVHKLLRARLSAPHPFQLAIAPALEGPQDHLKVVREKLRRRRDLTAEWANKTPRVSLVSPKGAFYAHPKLEIPDDDLSFVSDLLKQKHVLVVHGSGFGQKAGTKHMRIVFLPQEPVLSAAYEKMTEFMKERYGA